MLVHYEFMLQLEHFVDLHFLMFPVRIVVSTFSLSHGPHTAC